MTDKAGFIITLPGFNAETAAPENCALHSSYDTFKVKLDPVNPQFGNILVTFTDQPAAGTYQITVLHHGYGYIPFFYFYFSVRHSNALLNNEVGSIFGLDATNDAYFQVVPDIQNLTFNLVVTPNFQFDPSPAGSFYAFRYYIFANDGV